MRHEVTSYSIRKEVLLLEDGVIAVPDKEQKKHLVQCWNVSRVCTSRCAASRIYPVIKLDNEGGSTPALMFECVIAQGGNVRFEIIKPEDLEEDKPEEAQEIQDARKQGKMEALVNCIRLMEDSGVPEDDRILETFRVNLRKLL